jgi:transposase-like protein
LKDKTTDDSTPPKVCPYCKSTRIAAPTTGTGAATYWRCDGCGEMWNVARQRAAERPLRWNRF